MVGEIKIFTYVKVFIAVLAWMSAGVLAAFDMVLLFMVW